VRQILEREVSPPFVLQEAVERILAAGEFAHLAGSRIGSGNSGGRGYGRPAGSVVIQMYEVVSSFV
jgi:hypothetical protein